MLNSNENELGGVIIAPEGEISTKAEAEDYIRMYLQECSIMAGNDHEFPDIQKILNDLSADKITPVEAVEKAKAIRYSKMEKIG